ncbi:MAG: hypothetical protein AAGM84_12615 [Pseudomonadota bacterium]
MSYLIAAVLVLVFTANVVVGAINGVPVVGNVAEMLILFAAAIAFSVGILRSEARAKDAPKD